MNFNELKIKDVKIQDIEFSSTNPRQEMTDIEELADSIKKHGLLEPIAITLNTGESEKPYKLLRGARRVTAVASLGWEVIAAIKIPGEYSNDEFRLLQIIEHFQTKPLSIQEKFKVFNELVENGSKTKASKLLGLSSKEQKLFTRLLSLHPQLLEFVGNKLSIELSQKIALQPFQTQEKYYNDLKKSENIFVSANLHEALFKQNEKVLEDLPVCTACQYNTNLQKDLFDNSQHGLCLNVNCYEMKNNKILTDKITEITEKYKIHVVTTDTGFAKNLPVEVINHGVYFTLKTFGNFNINDSKLLEQEYQAVMTEANPGQAVYLIIGHDITGEFGIEKNILEVEGITEKSGRIEIDEFKLSVQDVSDLSLFRNIIPTNNALCLVSSNNIIQVFLKVLSEKTELMEDCFSGNFSEIEQEAIDDTEFDGYFDSDFIKGHDLNSPSSARFLVVKLLYVMNDIENYEELLQSWYEKAMEYPQFWEMLAQEYYYADEWIQSNEYPNTLDELSESLADIYRELEKVENENIRKTRITYLKQNYALLTAMLYENPIIAELVENRDFSFVDTHSDKFPVYTKIWEDTEHPNSGIKFTENIWVNTLRLANYVINKMDIIGVGDDGELLKLKPYEKPSTE